MKEKVYHWRMREDKKMRRRDGETKKKTA